MGAPFQPSVSDVAGHRGEYPRNHSRGIPAGQSRNPREGTESRATRDDHGRRRGAGHVRALIFIPGGSVRTIAGHAELAGGAERGNCPDRRVWSAGNFSGNAFRRIDPVPEKTVQTVKENVQWTKERIK
jgi:hypothetical protein